MHLNKNRAGKPEPSGSADATADVSTADMWLFHSLNPSE